MGRECQSTYAIQVPWEMKSELPALLSVVYDESRSEPCLFFPDLLSSLSAD
jgi:hypothetical protein